MGWYKGYRKYICKKINLYIDSDTSALPENSTVNFQKYILTKAWLPVSAMIIYRSIPNIQIVLTYFCKSFAIEWVTKICEFFACGLWI